jgi:thiosulfate dehydrogenase
MRYITYAYLLSLLALFGCAAHSTESDELLSTEIKAAPLSEFWQPADVFAIADKKKSDEVLYGRDLIIHTAYYFGPKGRILQQTNGLNCQNCHLDAGTKIFGNNYGSVASTYPKVRARSGQMESIEKRINDCFERSLNGKGLAENSREMRAMVAYMKFLGENMPKGEKAPGSGLKELPFLNRAADPVKGKAVYELRCASCHQLNGQGVIDGIGQSYVYPPLWGPHSFNDAAGLSRVSNMAKYVKYNMPLGVNHDAPELSDEDAWDVAAYIDSRPRPHKSFPNDWPDISKKPYDHPFGPYADQFNELQHKFGPFPAIKKARKIINPSI